MERIFDLVRNTENFHLYEAIISPGLVQVIYIEKWDKWFGVTPPPKLKMIVSTRNYSEKIEELKEQLSRLKAEVAKIQEEINQLK